MKVFLRFDGSPGPVPPRFIEAENVRGESISVGEWFKELPRNKSEDWFLVLEVRVEDVLEDKKRSKTFSGLKSAFTVGMMLPGGEDE